jgi:hypothetical protein
MGDDSCASYSGIGVLNRCSTSCLRGGFFLGCRRGCDRCSPPPSDLSSHHSLPKTLPSIGQLPVKKISPETAIPVCAWAPLLPGYPIVLTLGFDSSVVIRTSYRLGFQTPSNDEQTKKDYSHFHVQSSELSFFSNLQRYFVGKPTETRAPRIKTPSKLRIRSVGVLTSCGYN